MIKEYYSLVKPGLIYGNVITVIGGFALASRDHINFGLLFAAICGISFVMASGCVFNNYIDRDIDAKMERTKDRALVRGVISRRGTNLYGIILGVVGFLVLALFTNFLTTSAAFAGFFVYVVFYSLRGKRHTVHGAVIGSISGAVPPVVGYCAASNRFDAGAVILFVILVFWQLPHFFAIAIFRLDDYIAAGIPVLPAKYGIRVTKVNMLIYVIAFTVAALMLTIFGYTGNMYFIIALLLGTAWLGLCVKGFWARDDKRWARKMFFLSLAILVVLFIAMSVDVTRI